MTPVFLALGSNLGDRLAHLHAAVGVIAQWPETTLLKASGVYETPAVGGPAGQGAYLNQAIALETSLLPRNVLERSLALETERGRDRAIRGHWGPRELDVDILLFGDHVIDEPHLHVPHPRMAERAFVLTPLCDVAREVMHPVWQRTIGELAEALHDADAPVRVAEPSSVEVRHG